MYYQYLIYLYYIVWILCLFGIYRIIKLGVLGIRLNYHLSDNKPKFILKKIAPITIKLFLVVCIVIGVGEFNKYTDRLEQEATKNLDNLSSPNKFYCTQKVSEYFKKDILTEYYFAPTYYTKCLEVTPSFAFKNFCGKRHEGNFFRAECGKAKLDREQCNVLLKLADDHC